MAILMTKEERERKRILKKNMELNGDSIFELHEKLSSELINFNDKLDELNKIKESIVDKDLFLSTNNETQQRIGEIESKLYTELNDNYIQLVHDLFQKTNDVLTEYNEKYREIFTIQDEKFLKLEEYYFKTFEAIEEFKLLEETYKNIANNLIDERLTTEVLTDRTAEKAAEKILKAFNDELTGFGKSEKDSIYKALFEVLKQQEIVTSAPMEEREIKELPEGSKFHKSYKQLKNCVLAGVIPMIVGPAGSGKSHAIEQVAADLGLHFYMANRIQNTFELVGFVNAAGNYVTTQFYEAFTKGGLFFFDEVDASSPEALVTINAAVAQGYMAFPGHTTTIDMHKDFKVVVAGNTYGTGSTVQYTGRNKLDAATLDRFMIIDWDYDETLENDLVENKDLLQICWALRKASNKYEEVIISTRGIITLDKVLSLEANNKTMDVESIFEKKFFAGLKEDKIAKIVCNIDNESVKGNKYLDSILKIGF